MIFDKRNYQILSDLTDKRYRLLPGKLDLDKLDELKEADFYHDIIIFHADFEPEVERMIAPFFSTL